jgi:hypothetical protein
MESEQRYTGGFNNLSDEGKGVYIDQNFIDSVLELDHDAAVDIATQISENIDSLPIAFDFLQAAIGVSVNSLGDKVYFMIEFLKEEDGVTSLINIDEIPLDLFLDSYNDPSMLKFIKFAP